MSATNIRAQLSDSISAVLSNKIAGRELRWYLSGWRLGIILLVVCIILPFVLDGIDPSLVTTSIAIGTYIILALGLNIVVGYAGLLDLGYVAFFVIGSYTVAVGTYGFLQNAQGKSIPIPSFSGQLFWLLIPLAALLACLFGILLGAPTLRLRGDYLAIVTLGFGEIVPIVFQNVSQVSWNLPLVGPVSFNLGGANGFLGLDRPATLNLPFQTIMFTLNDSANFYYLVFALVIIATIGLVMLRKSRIGRAWVAIREDETAAACSGVNLVATKLTAFAIGASVSGFAGVLYGSQYGVISPESFMFVVSITILVMIVLGGMGS